MESIKRARNARGLSLAEVAEATGLLAPAVARAERAGVDPRASTVQRIARALGVPVCQLFDDQGNHGRHQRRRRK